MAILMMMMMIAKKLSSSNRAKIPKGGRGEPLHLEGWMIRAKKKKKMMITRTDALSAQMRILFFKLKKSLFGICGCHMRRSVKIFLHHTNLSKSKMQSFCHHCHHYPVTVATIVRIQ
jgi:hypothetical protein